MKADCLALPRAPDDLVDRRVFRLQHQPVQARLIEPSPRQAAGRVLPETAVLRSTVRIKIIYQFARYRGSLRLRRSSERTTYGRCSRFNGEGPGI